MIGSLYMRVGTPVYPDRVLSVSVCVCIWIGGGRGNPSWSSCRVGKPGGGWGRCMRRTSSPLRSGWLLFSSVSVSAFAAFRHKKKRFFVFFVLSFCMCAVLAVARVASILFS